MTKGEKLEQRYEICTKGERLEEEKLGMDIEGPNLATGHMSHQTKQD
jgi:hypothetical protein